jgi:hypothetical protein
MKQIPWLVIRVCAGILLCASSALASTIAVPAGASLQQAINAAQPGDTIALQPGATFAGSFTLPWKGGDAWITIRTASDAGLPGDGGRISPAHAGALATIRQGSGAPALTTAAGAHHWRLSLLEIQGNGNSDIVTLGDGSSGQRSLSQVPHDLVVDRVYIHGDASAGQKRGIALNSASTAITGSYISDIKAAGQDSQAILGWNGPGPYSITNNYLEAAGENVMFGGADPSIPGLVPSDITIADNQFAKQPSWRGERWVVKNLIELKNARRVSIVRNTFDYNWQGGQSGYAVVFTVRNQDGGCPWCQVDHVSFEQNIVRHSSAGVQILGYDNNHPSQQTNAIVVRNNLFADIDSQNWGGNGYFVSLSGGARDITVDHNTVISDHGSGVVTLDGPPILGFTFTNNLVRHNSYGFIGTDHGVGNDSIAAFLPGSIISRNVIAGGAAGRYPGDNSFPAPAQFEAQFASYRGGDYSLVPGSPWRGAGADGQDLGAILSAAPPAPPRSARPIEGEGVISGGPVGSSSCPSLAFMVGGYVVKIDPSTQFDGGSCGALRLGMTIRGRGIVNADGTVSLSYLSILN